ncbi:hypothetical protein ACWGJ9_09915 [Curtobacterium citreum]
MSALTIQHRDSGRTLRAAMPLNGEWSQNDCATPSYQLFAKVNTV